MRAPSLTPEQKAVVEASDGPHLVVAPPGSGKTEVLIRRALWLVERSLGEPFRILAVTYTERAAGELAERARQSLGDEAWRVHASTLHAFCLDTLQHYGEAVGVSGDVTILDDDALRRGQLAGALAGLGHRSEERELEELLSQIDNLRADLVVPSLVPDHLVSQGGVSLREAYQAYEESLDDHQVLDFPGILYRGWRLLQEDEWVGFHQRRQFRHLLVDEAQDLTETHIAILRALCSDELRNIFVVADDDQEIYSFAGANSKHYTDFARDLAAQRHRLSTNFRCATKIIAAAELLREHIRTMRVEHEPIVGATTAPGWIGVRPFPDPIDEALGVAAWAQALLADGLDTAWLAEGEDRSVAPEDICIMARTRFGFEPVAQALDDAGIDAVMRTEEAGLFDSIAGQAVYLGLRVLANPRDRASQHRFDELLGNGPSNRVAEVTAAYPATGTPTGRAELLQRLELPDELLEVTLEEASAEAPWEALERIPLPPADPDGQDRSERELWEADITRLTDFWDHYAALSRKPERKLTAFLREVARAHRTPPEAPGVRLLTPYRAKGLQFRAIAVIGMVQGTFPHYRATTDHKIDLERRALYVAMTRAARAALFTYPLRRPDRWGRVHHDPPSQFLSEAGLITA